LCDRRIALPPEPVLEGGESRFSGFSIVLVLNRSEKEWTMGAREWIMAKAQFAILFGERFTRAMAP
jgi:hypothetical protein